MKNFRMMKHLALAAGLLALCGAPALRAQTPQSDPGQQTPQHTQRHNDDLASLNLTDDQKAQVQKIHENMKSQMDTVKGDTTLTQDQKHSKMEAIRKESHEQVKQVLTPEQRAQLRADHKAEKQQGSQAPPQQ
jgi:Spy/CpxP family protein refolding chaperone